ncbi:MAG TPA: enoyl-CoA hydratase/isomerase family protein [Pseudosphingobacterium sp.]|nr:enoyl-CoA hydratase/isomerase family protein [Pseudosphingobacterium sp.]
MDVYKEESGTVRTEVDKKVATVAFYHPSHNALPSSLLAQLAAVIRRLGKNPSIQVILLKSDGEGTFCAGANFDELLSIQDESSGKAFFSGFAHVINAIRLARQPVVGRIQGKALGGAVGLAAACDYCFATKEASIKLSELSIGIGPFVIAPVVKRKIGLSALTELTLNPTIFKHADWALEKGLYQSVSEDIETMDRLAHEFCIELSSYSPSALSAIKETLWQGTESWDTLLLTQAEISGRLVVDKRTKTILRKFKAKTK